MSLAKAIAALSFGSIAIPASGYLHWSTLLSYSEKIKVNNRHKSLFAMIAAVELTSLVGTLEPCNLGVISPTGKVISNDQILTII